MLISPAPISKNKPLKQVVRATPAFSLVEVMVVVLILAIAAGAVTLRLSGPLKMATMDEIVVNIGSFDGQTRSYCREQDRPTLVEINLDAGTLTRFGQTSGERVGSQLAMPSAWRIAVLKVRGTRAPTGKSDILYSRLGYAPSYAIMLESTDGRSQWLLSCGMTGQLVKVNDENKVNEILAQIDASDDGLHAY
jgi:prepilin-type N-terminal cleavage/methylation domain-containing protein